MAEERPRRRRSDDEPESKPRRRRSEDDDEARERRRTRERLSGAELSLRARNELAKITGLEPEGAISLSRSGEDTWTVTVEFLELSRTPETEDLLGSYEVELDERGRLLSYRRVRRYPRSQAGDERELRGGRRE